MPVKNGRWWLTQDRHQIVMNAAPERIYDLVADLPRMGEWSPECKRVEWAKGTTVPAVGAKFVGHNQFVTEEGGRESTVWRYRFEPVEGGTRVTESYEVRWIPVWARIVDVPANRHRELQDTMRHTLEQVKCSAELAHRMDPAQGGREGQRVALSDG